MSNEHTQGDPIAENNEKTSERSEGRRTLRNQGNRSQGRAGQAKPASGEGTSDQRNGQNRRRRNTTRHKTVSVEHKRPQITPEDKMEKESFAKPRTRNASKTTGGTRRRAGVKKNPAAKLKIIPLGGLDAIGKNMTVFECGDDMLLVDAGL
ncbi:MAG: ribonuclease J, partial [Slackia sp.]|nr:ribonuclease J [Slackia sp.]